MPCLDVANQVVKPDVMIPSEISELLIRVTDDDDDDDDPLDSHTNNVRVGVYVEACHYIGVIDAIAAPP